MCLCGKPLPGLFGEGSSPLTPWFGWGGGGCSLAAGLEVPFLLPSCWWESSGFIRSSLLASIIDRCRKGLTAQQVAYCWPGCSCHSSTCSKLGSWGLHWQFRGAVPQQLCLSVYFLPVAQKLFSLSHHIYIYIIYYYYYYFSSLCCCQFLVFSCTGKAAQLRHS